MQFQTPSSSAGKAKVSCRSFFKLLGEASVFFPVLDATHQPPESLTVRVRPVYPLHFKLLIRSTHRQSYDSGSLHPTLFTPADAAIVPHLLRDI
jgi:hypothetical protein